jgi:hypothetical protein
MHRSNRQIKSHGQKVAARYYNGEDIFEPLKNWKGKNMNVVDYHTVNIHPPSIYSVRSTFDKRTDAKSFIDEDENKESNTLAGILCSMKHRA